MATINDVAREAEVSRSTVSRVINQRSEVNEETREIVLQAMRKLNYSPNSSARALAKQKTNNIGVVAMNLVLPFYSNIIDGIYRSADELGYGTLFCIHNNTESRANVRYLDMLYGTVDGIIFVGENSVSRRDLVKFTDKEYPIVMIESSYNIPSVVSINVDNFQGAYLATRHLIQLGHRRIAHLKGRDDWFQTKDRMEGYIQALKDYALNVDNKLIVSGNFVYNDAYECSKELLDQKSGITAVFCANDVMAAAFMHAANEKGVKIPDDISVVGFDDIQDKSIFIRSMMPDITTIRQPIGDMVQYAVKSLVSRFTNGEAIGSKVFDMELIKKESTRQI
jgi:LacI family transcriptional regulator